MKTLSRFKVISFFLIAAYLLAACSGTLSQSSNSSTGPKAETNVVAFTGIVEAITATQWTVSGQEIILDPQAAWDPGITVGDEVRVEANVSADGAVVATKVESTVRRSVDVSSTPAPVSIVLPAVSSMPDVSASPELSSTPDTSSTQVTGTIESEIVGAVEAITADAITINGVTYSLGSFTEIKDVLRVGDQVRLHVILSADGTLTVREVETSVSLRDDSSNSNGSGDGPIHDSGDDHSNGNSNDDSSEDHSDDNSNSGSGDD